MTYEELCSFETLYNAYLEARKGKRSKSKTIQYEASALACTEKLSRKLAVREASMCPSARLTAWDNRTGKPYEFIFEPSLGLIEDPAIGASGGLWVRGGIHIQREDGRTFEVRNRVVLCRCGHSRNKPYCDGAHAAVKWQDALEGTPDGETLPRSVASAKIETH